MTWITEDWGDETIDKAQDLVRMVGAVRHDPDIPSVWWVASLSTQATRYRVQIDEVSEEPEWITCTCPNGMAIGVPRCYHALAVLLKIKEIRDASDRYDS